MKIGLVAGEASGDLLGAGLIRALTARVPGALFEGVAGAEMTAAGCEQWEPAESLAVMGLIEHGIIKGLPRGGYVVKRGRGRVVASRAD